MFVSEAASLMRHGRDVSFREPPMQAFATAASGIASASARFEASAARTARDPLSDLAGETVERLTAAIALKANVAVLKTADEMAGALLDIRA